MPLLGKCKLTFGSVRFLGAEMCHVTAMYGILRWIKKTRQCLFFSLSPFYVDHQVRACARTLTDTHTGAREHDRSRHGGTHTDMCTLVGTASGCRCHCAAGIQLML